MQLQDLVESAIIRLQTGMALENFTGVSLQQMPFPCHKEDMSVLTNFGPVIIERCFVLYQYGAVRHVVECIILRTA